ncbi:MAG: prephenate dehydrogenase/arogenate dehydrogenase family protein, partial [Oscillospiraceae bacterium]|nr:prephenate dehydrogenase/arogenate dehydrogenase family protein [Oscillospiraceae bacterium]
MTIAIVGLGLMGGSLALALRGFEKMNLWGVDTDPAAREAALESGGADAVFEELPAGADVVIICLPPAETVALAGRYASFLKPGCLFCEICGVKAALVPRIARALPPGVDYLPLHPMAGKETGGYARADANLFAGAGLIVTTPDGSRPRRASLLERTAR